MPKVEKYLKALAPGSLYAEFAKRQDCWDAVKKESFIPRIDQILKDDFFDPNARAFRARLADSELEQHRIEGDIARIREIEGAVWKRIAEWGRASQELTQQEITAAQYLPAALRRRGVLDDGTREMSIRILNKAFDKVPELFLPVSDSTSDAQKVRDAAKNLLKWSRKNRVLIKSDEEFLATVTQESSDASSAETTGRIMALLKTAAKKGFGS